VIPPCDQRYAHGAKLRSRTFPFAYSAPPLNRFEYGRIAKTLHLLALVDPVDGSYQRRMNRRTSTAWVVMPSPPSRLQSGGRCATRTHAMARTESSDVARKGIQARDV
jgi:hypothetical protein